MLTRVFNKIYYSENGASMVEYALLIALIAIVVFAAAKFFGNALSDTYGEIGDELLNANNA